MRKVLAILIGVMALCALTTNASAMVITNLTPSIAILGAGTGLGAGTQADPIMIYETITGAGSVDLQITERGQGNPGGSGHGWGRWFRKVVTNNSGSAWTSFEHELHVILGIPSADGDGLSFAQGYSPRPFSSDLLPNWTEIILEKDFVNFYGGRVDVGQTVTFNFYVTDNSYRDLFYMRQNPNAPVPGIPEPATMSLLGLGLLGLAGLRNRRKV